VSPFDELDQDCAATVETVSPDRLQHVRERIADDLIDRHDAWPAVRWLAATGDDRAKRSVIDDLDQVMSGVSRALLTDEAAADNIRTEVVFGRALHDRRQIGRAFEFSSALRASLTDPPVNRADPGFEEKVRRRRRRAEAHEQRIGSLARLGVQPGKGLPFWELYMRRRDKKSWGS